MIKDTYLITLIETLESVEFSNKNQSVNADYTDYMQILANAFREIKKKQRRVFFIGNGGSAAIASHMTADFMKNGEIHTYSLYDNAAITCMGNDYGYENVFAKQLSFLMEEGDLLVCISSSGNSENIVKAVQVAKEKNACVVTFTGFKMDNKIRMLGDYNVYVPIEKYGIVETIHNLILQQLVDML